MPPGTIRHMQGGLGGVPTKAKQTLAQKRRMTYVEGLAVAKATIYKGLDAVDLLRCQGETRTKLSPFTMGGQIQQPWVRCDRKPSMVAVEVKQDRLTRTRGAMALCRSCAKVCEERRKDVTMLPAAPFKAAYKLGGHQAVKDMVYAHRDQ